MSPKITVHRAPGTRDFLPEEMALRKRIITVIEETFQLYGFQPLETPSLERLEVLTGKYGEEADRLIFKILKRGEELESGKASGELADLGLRYDLTVPLARVVAMHRGELTFPFKRYQIQPVWRAERQQKGRYREFFQCDADIVGTSSPSADAEIIALTDDILQKLGIPGYRIHINHRLLLQALTVCAGIPNERFLEACIVIDKLEKVGWNGIRDELIEKQFDPGCVEKLIGYLLNSGEPQELLGKIAHWIADFADGEKAIRELRLLFADLAALNIAPERLSFSLHMARGLDYYTGPIFETLIEEPRIGSITGGGRYDNLIGVFSGESIPATGTTIGIERIFDVMRELNLFGEIPIASAQVLVALFSEETRAESLKIAAALRRAGIAAEVYLEPAKKLAKQFAYADKKKIPFVIVAGPEELSRGEVALKRLVSGKQEYVSRSSLTDQLRKEIGHGRSD